MHMVVLILYHNIYKYTYLFLIYLYILVLYHWSYRPKLFLWVELESNQRPLVYQTSALNQLSYLPIVILSGMPESNWYPQLGRLV